MAHLYLVQTEHLDGTLWPGIIMRATSSTPGVGPWAATINDCGQKDVTLADGTYSVDFFDGDQLVGHRDWVLADPPADPIRVGLAGGTPVPPPVNIRRILGAIWPTRSPVAFGPRAGQADNITDTGCEAYTLDDRIIARDATRKRKYTHIQTGSYVDPGYHNQYPPVDIRQDPMAILEWLEWWQAQGFALVNFLGPDGWTTQQMIDELEPIFLSTPRWQNVMRQIVPYGWEPSKDTSNAQFVERFQWARRVFPHAHQYIHLAADFDAPGNNDDFTPGQPKFIGMPEAWHRVVPYLTGYLVQNGPYGVAPADDPVLAKNFGDQFDVNVKGSLKDRFTNGYAGWPTVCATGEPLDVIAGEQTSFEAYWENLAEAASQSWGQLALQRGADGAFDGVLL